MGSCLDHLGIILESFWGHVRIILDSFWGSLWGHVGVILGIFWGGGVVVGSFWVSRGIHFGLMLGNFGFILAHSGLILAPCWQHDTKKSKMTVSYRREAHFQ